MICTNLNIIYDNYIGIPFGIIQNDIDDNLDKNFRIAAISVPILAFILSIISYSFF